MASVRLFTCSFSKIFRLCPFTVLSARKALGTMRIGFDFPLSILGLGCRQQSGRIVRHDPVRGRFGQQAGHSRTLVHNLDDRPNRTW